MASEKGGFNWVMGCGIGCGGLILVALLGVGGIWYAANQAMEAGKIAIVEEIESDFAAQLEEVNIPEEHIDLIADLVSLAADEDTSFAMVLMCAVAYDVGVDGDADMEDAERYKIVQDVIDFVSEDPGAGFIKMGTFISENPEYEDLFNDLESRGNSGDFTFDDDDYSEPAVEEESPAPSEELVQ
jgi:hypothetical protein